MRTHLPLLAAVLAGCTMHSGEAMTEERLALVKPGMTREQVEAAWGKPQLAQEVEGELRLCYNESTLEMGFMGIGSTVEAKTTIVVLRDGLVVEVRKSSSGK